MTVQIHQSLIKPRGKVVPQRAHPFRKGCTVVEELHERGWWLVLFSRRRFGLLSFSPSGSCLSTPSYICCSIYSSTLVSLNVLAPFVSLGRSVRLAKVFILSLS